MNLINLKSALKTIKSGLPVIFPTDTLPAIGCLPKFSKIIYEFKKRDRNKPLILMGSEREQLIDYVHDSAKEDFEKIALLGGDDGLKHIREIIKKAPFFLKEKGWIILENHFDQGQKVKELLIQNNFKSVEIVNDLSGVGRFTIGRYK